MVEQTIELANETTSTTTRGSSVGTVYGLQPVEFTKEIVEAAKAQFYFANFVRVMYAPQGVKDVVIPKHKKYLGGSGVTFDTSEATNADISNTALSSFDNVTATPAINNAQFIITDYNARTNLVNLVEAARDELAEALGQKVETSIATALGDATLTTSTVGGAQLIFGGDATTDATLALGDVITTEMVAKAIRLLKDTKAYYWNSTVFTKSSGTKNPWSSSSDDPFVLFIAPSQEEVFRKDSQFTNAAEYGSNSIVRNGEIGDYLGVKIVVSPYMESLTGTGSAPGPDGTNVASGVTMTRCILCKPKKACALVYGMEPMVEIARIPWRAQTAITLQSAFQAKVVQDDAIVFLDVADY